MWIAVAATGMITTPARRTAGHGPPWVNVLTMGTSIVRTVVSPKTLHLVALGEKAQLVAQGYAGDSSLVPGHYSWTVRQALPLLSVDSLGGVTALAVGSAWVVATEKGGTADSAQVTIEQLTQSVPVAPARATAQSATRFTARRRPVVAGARPVGVAETPRTQP